MFHALVIEDDAVSQLCLTEVLSDSGFEARVASRVEQARTLLEEQPADILVVDLMLPDGSGLDILRDLKGRAATQVVVITGHASVESVTSALRLGACDYLTKPIEMERLQAIITNLRRTLEKDSEINKLREQLRELGQFGPLLGASEPMQKVYDLITVVAPTDASVFIRGESGTGKELVAQAIHQFSQRASKPFLAVNCGAIAPTLMESELFGHEKGSFTGADRVHRGLFERANGGTLFLDEITEMPFELQVKLLRVLETGTALRVGGDQLIQLNVRVLAATNRVPEEAVVDGKLREDLLYRLNVFPIPLPPLRERGLDVTHLAGAFLSVLNRETGNAKKLTSLSLDRLLRYSWPGNVRELKNVIHRAYILAGEEIEPAHLFDETQERIEATGPNVVLKVGVSLADAEERLIKATLAHLDGNKKRAAEVLGISVRTLYYRLNGQEAEGGEKAAAAAAGHEE